MNRFIIVDGLPYLLDKGKAYRVSWTKNGFTVGNEAQIGEIPAHRLSAMEVLAKCKGNLSSMEAPKEREQTEEPKKAAMRTRGKNKPASEGEAQGKPKEGNAAKGAKDGNVARN